MSKSFKQPVIKDKPRNTKRTTLYWRPLRRIWKTLINKDFDRVNFDILEDMELPDRKSLINDYDYCDYIIDKRFEKPKKHH